MPSKTHEMDRVSFTADGIAARRTIMDIPRSQDIYDVLREKIAGTEEESALLEALKPENLFIAPFFEARYRLLDKLLAGVHAENILELAAGLAPRGINWALDPDTDYVELDLPRKSGQKREIIETLVARSKIPPHDNFNLEGGDVLSADDFERAASHFYRGGPVIVANEGLMRYLTFDQKRVLARNVKRLLERVGGYWITPDVNFPDPLDLDPRLKGYADKMRAKLDMNVDANLFESIPAARTFFEDLGFEIEEHSFREAIPEMVSPEYLKLSSEELERLIGWRMAFVMKLKTHS